METTALIILEYNNSDDTLNCIKSVLRYNSAPVKFIIVDNASSKQGIIQSILSGVHKLFPSLTSKDIVLNPKTTILPKVTVVEAAENQGYAAGNNIGLYYAYKDSDIKNVMILNSDILFVEDIIPRLIANLTDGVAIVSPILFKRDMKSYDLNCARRSLANSEILKLHFPIVSDPWHVSANRKIPFRENTGLKEIELPSGSCMLAKKSLFKTIGGFDPNTFLYYEEDILWEKIKMLGMRNFLDTNVRCIHLGATSTKNSPSRFIVNTSTKSAQYLLNNYRNPNILQKVTMSLFRFMIDIRMRLVEALGKLKVY